MLGNKGKIRTLISFIMIFALILMSFPSMAITTHDFQQTYTIFAGKTTDVGNATFTVDGDQLTIEVALNENCVAEEYHLHILESLPEDRPAPGNDPFVMKEFDEPEASFTIGPLDIPFLPIESGQCEDLYFILHLVTNCCQEPELRCDCPEPCKSETAYAGTIVEPDKGSWFGYVEIEFCDEEEEEEFGSLQIFKFEDEENRGTYDEGEMPLSGIQFRVFGPDDEELEDLPYTTNSEGVIFLSNLPVGDYRIQELSENEITTPVFADGYYIATVTKDQLTEVNVGNLIPDIPTWDIYIHKFEDMNRSGKFEIGERLLSNIIFELYDDPESELPLIQTTTNSSGEATFTNLEAGTYYLKEPSGNEITAPEFDEDGFLEIKVGPELPVTFWVGNYIEDEDEDGSITIWKFNDENKNGVWDEGESALKDIAFKLHVYAVPISVMDSASIYQTELVEFQSGLTDAAGKLVFDDLPFGDYYLEELSPFEITGPSALKEGKMLISVTSNDPDQDVWVGNSDDAVIVISKFLDENHNGVWDDEDPNEDALEGIRFYLYNSLSSEAMPVATGMTDEIGKIEFSDLDPGHYYLFEDTEYIITTHDTSDGIIDLGILTANSRMQVVIGNYMEEEEEEHGTIIVHKFNDADRDGKKDENESWLSGIEFELFKSMDDSVPVDSGKTNGDGMITFEKLDPGDYYLDELGSRIITTSKNSRGFIHIEDLDAGETLHEYVGNYKKSPPKDDDDDDDDDEVLKGMIRVHKFLDSDKDGNMDEGEMPMVGVTFELYDAAKDEVLFSKTSDREGVLTFSNLELGSYYLKEISSYEITSNAFGTDGFTTSAVVVDSDEIIHIYVGNVRKVMEPVAAVTLPEAEEIAEEPVPLALPQTGEMPPTTFYILGALLMLAGMCLKRFE